MTVRQTTYFEVTGHCCVGESQSSFLARMAVSHGGLSNIWVIGRLLYFSPYGTTRNPLCQITKECHIFPLFAGSNRLVGLMYDSPDRRSEDRSINDQQDKEESGGGGSDGLGMTVALAAAFSAALLVMAAAAALVCRYNIRFIAISWKVYLFLIPESSSVAGGEPRAPPPPRETGDMAQTDTHWLLPVRKKELFAKTN